VGVPRVIPTREGRLFDDNLVVFSFVEGRRPIGDREWRRVADELRRIHGMTRSWPQRPTFASTQDLLTRATGGDVDLRMMPDTAVSLCREAWRSIGSEETSAIHGDPLGNVLISDSEIVFIDWDETRVDASLLDLADLPLTDDDRAVLATVRRAANAWEAACSWVLEPDYARRRLENLS
jgi:hypothetical protein